MKTVLILGNGKSRLRLRNQINSFWKGEIWACNMAFKECNDFIRMDRVFTQHEECISSCLEYRARNKSKYILYTDKSLFEKGMGDKQIQYSYGWATGNAAILEAIKEGYKKIVLAGFDFGGRDIYQSEDLPGYNFKKQFQTIISEEGDSRIRFLDEGYMVKCSKDFPDKNFRGRERVPLLEPSSLLREVPLREFIKEDQSVLIIGNSPEVFNKSLGEKIDEFDHVVRINAFEIEGYEKFVGTKTTIWCSGASSANTKFDVDIENIKLIVLIPISTLNRENLHNMIEERLLISREDFEILPKSDIEYINSIHNLPAPTTGFNLINYFVEVLKINNLYVHGFDFFEKKYHYYDKNCVPVNKIGDNHDFDSERMYFHSLIEQGKIKELK